VQGVSRITVLYAVKHRCETLALGKHINFARFSLIGLINGKTYFQCLKGSLDNVWECCETVRKKLGLPVIKENPADSLRSIPQVFPQARDGMFIGIVSTYVLLLGKYVLRQ